MGEHTLSAGTSDKRMYWLSQLQRARREFSQAGAAAAAKSSMACQVKIFNHYFTKTLFALVDYKCPNLKTLNKRDIAYFLNNSKEMSLIFQFHGMQIKTTLFLPLNFIKRFL